MGDMTNFFIIIVSMTFLRGKKGGEVFLKQINNGKALRSKEAALIKDQKKPIVSPQLKTSLQRTADKITTLSSSAPISVQLTWTHKLAFLSLLRLDQILQKTVSVPLFLPLRSGIGPLAGDDWCQHDLKPS